MNRGRPGDHITVLDGKGGIFQGIINHPSSTGCEVELEESERVPSPGYGVLLAVGPTKNLDRMEWMVEKTVELGVERLDFLLCEYSERKVIKPDRLVKKAISAIKQSGNPFLPQIGSLVPVKEYLSMKSGFPGCIAHPEAANPHLIDYAIPGKSYRILIGPEGGFSPAELEMADEQGVKPIGLGNSVLRTETAGVVACHTLHLVNRGV